MWTLRALMWTLRALMWMCATSQWTQQMVGRSLRRRPPHVGQFALATVDKPAMSQEVAGCIMITTTVDIISS
eukprot:8439199-Pyramimonas_sp.AAC.1